jgi:Calcineurin-like phosphoesterase
MRAHVVSDEHHNIECNGRIVRPVDCDLVICAGDAGPPLRESLKWFANTYPNQRKIYTPGNHDYYSAEVKKHPELKTTYQRERAEAPALARDLGIDLLDTGSVVIDGVRFLGTTLWTDFMSAPSYLMWGDRVRAAMRMNDYRCIKTGKGRGGDRLLPRDTINAHKIDVRWLTEQLAIPFDGETVVVTHHAPSERSLMGPDGSGSGRVGNDLDWCYASALDYLMMAADSPEAIAHNLSPDHVPPSMWIHGHVHANQDYQIGDCRVLANPRGYPKYAMPNAPRENPAFDDQLVVELGCELTLRPGM